ncbi:hypothetical protein NDA17_004195 [Ustilago hordei]|nr:hypothetical protein NDA17_004195 [Ustilago hordei]
MALEDPTPVLIEGFSIVKAPTTSTSNCQFIKVVPNFLTFSRLWVVFLSLRSSSSPDRDLLVSLRRFYQHVVDLAEVFPWEKVAGYIIAVCTSHLGRATMTEWAHFDTKLHATHFQGVQACLPPSSSTNKKPGLRHDDPRCKQRSAPVKVLHPGYTIWSPDQTAQDELVPLMSLLHSVNPVTTPSPHPGKLQQLLSPCLPTAMPPSPQSRLIPVWSSSSPIWLSNFSLSQPVPVSNLGSLLAPVTPPLPDPLQVLLADLASAALTSLQTLQPPVRPNTTMAAPLHSADGLSARHGSMQAVSGNWRQALHCYPDPFFVVQLLGAIEHGVHLGYSGPLRHCGCHHHIKNLPMDDRSKSHIWSEISAWVQEGWLLEVDPQQFNLVCSPVGTILDFVQEHLGCHLWKSDLTDAFRHVITTLADARLLSFSFDGHFFMETGLTFRGHSSPWIFNLFAEALHWIVQLAMGHPVDHYLDDFFGAVPASTDPGQLLHVLALACLALGLQLALQKTFWDTTKLEILGIQIDSVQQSVSITSEWCICILEAIDNLLHQCSAHLLDWQRVASLLQFVSQVVPHVLHVDNTNVKFSLCNGRSHDPLTQTLLHMLPSGAFAPLPSHLCRAPTAFVATTGCSPLATMYIWQGHAASSRSCSTSVPGRYRAFVDHRFRPSTPPFPASDLLLTEWVCDLAQSHSFHSVWHELDALRSWHVDLSFTLDGFCHGCLEHAVHSIKRTHGLWPAAPKLPITLPLLWAILGQLQTLPLGAWDCQVITTAFAVSFSCFLQCGEVTWSRASPATLLVGLVMWQDDYAILLLPASKTNPF